MLSSIRLLGACFGLLAFVACAKMAEPPGGPPDTTPPNVLAVAPETSAVDVPVTAPIRIQFSEKVDEKSLESAIWVTPGGVSKPRIDFDGETAEIQLGRALPESTTIGVLVTTLVRDRRGTGFENRLGRPVRWVFSTGRTLWPGRIRGTLETVGVEPRGAGVVLVALYAEEGDSIPDPTRAEPLAITQPDTTNRFDLTGLPARGVPMWLFAMYDRNGNGQIAGTGEFASAVPESVFLSADAPGMNVKLKLVDPRAPATVEGTIVTAEADTIVKWVELFAAGADSASLPPRRSQVGKKGLFSVSNLRPGRFRLTLFCDVNGNGARDADEPSTPFGELDLAPGSKRQIGNWRITGCQP
ncbi:MAG TPA: Ig-like domain-containing protein [Candidatus Eisenbacteria bacterium]|nr:Ig-like domain-containing protein [Candidatus Eisenbacteria bacterium]